MGMAYIYKRPGRQVWMCRFNRKRGEGVITISTGQRSRVRAMRFSNRIEDLVDAWRSNRSTPQELRAWVDTLSDGAAKRLASYDLIDLVEKEVRRPIIDHINEWERVVGARGNNTADHAQRYGNYLRMLAGELNWLSYDDIDSDAILTLLKDRQLAPATRRKYMTAVGDFCRWMVARRRARVVRAIYKDKPRPTPQWDRRPFTPEEISQLLEYLIYAAPRYQGQNGTERWTCQDRALIYQTAVYTAYRKNELASLRVRHLDLRRAIGYVDIDARDAKNRTAAAVPIGEELTRALLEHVSGKHPNANVFWITRGRSVTKTITLEGGKKTRVYDRSGGAKLALHRDLRCAGLGHLLETDQAVDFHSLRATAITWWLEGHTPSGQMLSAERVRRLARLSSLAMVQKYVRGSRDDDVSWLMTSSEPGVRRGVRG